MRVHTMRIQELPPIVLATTAQLAAVTLIVLAALVVTQLFGGEPRWSVLVWPIGWVAMVLGSRWGLPSWWRLIQLLFAPALYWALQLALPPWIYLVLLILCLLLLSNSVADRVPLYLSSAAVWARLEQHLPHTAGARVLDLGSGLGGGLAWLAPRHPDVQFVGVENSPLLWLLSRLRLMRFSNAEIRWRNLWVEPLHDYDVIYAFLSPAPMRRLWDKAKAEMRPGSLFISNSFDVPGIEPDEQIVVGDRRGSVLHLWRL